MNCAERFNFRPFRFELDVLVVRGLSVALLFRARRACAKRFDIRPLCFALDVLVLPVLRVLKRGSISRQSHGRGRQLDVGDRVAFGDIAPMTGNTMCAMHVFMV